MPEVLTSDGPMASSEEPDFTMFENKTGLAEDLKFLASIPELCDVTFLVGETREPVCAVKVCRWIFFMSNHKFFMKLYANDRIIKQKNPIKC